MSKGDHDDLVNDFRYPEPKAHETRAHSELGASSCSRWWNCPGSVALSRLAKGGNSSPAARRGTAAHEVAEQCLTLSYEAKDFLGETLTVEGEEIEIDQAIVDGVQIYLDTCNDVMALAGERWIEVSFDLTELKPPAPMFGTADFVAYNPTQQKLWVVDYKNGYMHVPAYSPQLKYYAVGAAIALGPKKPVRSVEVIVVQPNGADEPVRSETYTVTELAEWTAALLVRAAATQKANAAVVPGKWCQFCPVRATCPERERQALAVASTDFTSLVSGEVHVPELRVLSPQDLGYILSKADMLEGWLKDVRAAAMAELSEGREVPGWKLVAKRPVRKWKDAPISGEYLTTLGVDAFEKVTISPAKAEAALSEKFDGLKLKKDRVAKAKEALADLIESVSGGVTLAPEADAREPVSLGHGDFKPIEKPKKLTNFDDVSDRDFYNFKGHSELND